MKSSAKHLIWIDLEMTGLNIETDRIIEIAVVITNNNLEILAEGPVLAIHQTDETLKVMDAWNTKQHHNSGLTERVKKSILHEKDAEKIMLEFISPWVPPKKSPMCGNSICQDRRFLYRHLPTLEAYFHYRNLDVSAVKELAKRWAPEMAKGFKKKSKHQALSDIHDSINELKYYREHFFKEV